MLIFYWLPLRKARAEVVELGVSVAIYNYLFAILDIEIDAVVEWLDAVSTLAVYDAHLVIVGSHDGAIIQEVGSIAEDCLGDYIARLIFKACALGRCKAA